MDKEKNLVWMDLEMTGLDPESSVIIEIATIVTNSNLETIAELPVYAIHQPDSIIDNMDEWNTSHHTASGLVQRVKDSKWQVEKVEELILKDLEPYTAKRSNPLCGNTIGQDRRFLYKYMPVLSEYLHYRSIDVSTIKELAHRWYPDFSPFPKKEAHLALDDIKESIEELQYYREKVFVQP